MQAPRRHNEDFIRAMVARFPGLRPLLNEHRQDQDGELLPHLFFADLTRYLLSLLSDESNVCAGRDLREMLDYLDDAYGNGALLQELISVSFLENLQGEDPQMRLLLGPNLKRQMEVICS